MVATTGIVPKLIPLKAAIFPAPDAAKPIEGVLLTQLNTAPAVPTKVTAPVSAPLHTTWSAGSTTLGVGFTVIVKVCTVPVHDPKTGVTVIVATTGTAPRFTPVKAAIFPVPDAASPIEAVLLVHV
jgi:hypothetical protein